MNLVFKGFDPRLKQFFEIFKGKKVVEVIEIMKAGV